MGYEDNAGIFYERRKRRELNRKQGSKNRFVLFIIIIIILAGVCIPLLQSKGSHQLMFMRCWRNKDFFFVDGWKKDREETVIQFSN